MAGESVLFHDGSVQSMLANSLPRLPAKWSWTTLGQAAAFINGDRGTNYPKQSDFVTNGVAFVNTGHIASTGRLNLGGMQYISRTCFDRLSSGKLTPGDIVYCLRGSTIGKIARVDLAEGAVASSLVIIRSKPGISQDYLYYFLSGPSGQRQVKQHENGSAQPNLSVSAISRYPLPLPPLAEQEAIVAVLGALDDKIELNKRMNATLEGISRSLFKSWFVDFAPVRAKLDGRPPAALDAATAALFPAAFQDSSIGHIPRGWEAAELGQIANVIDCLHAKKPERRESGQLYLQLNNIRDDGLIDITECFFVSAEDYQKWISRMEAVGGDCVVTNVGRVGAVGQIPDGVTAALGRNITGIRCKAVFPFPTFLIECLLSESMREEIRLKTDSGTILDALNVKSIPKLRFCRPSPEIGACFENLTRPVRRLMEQNISESRTIASLRDTLLPKLLSGELDVSQIQKVGT